MSGRSHTRAQRVLACLNCQQRKVKCDRKFPCANCVRHQVECEPALAPRQRRRRFPERDLLDRIRRYEEILRRNDLSFEPLHPDNDDNSNPATSLTVHHASQDGLGSDIARGHTSTCDNSSSKSIDIWSAIKQKLQSLHGQEHTSNSVGPNSDAGYDDAGDDDIIGDAAIERIWDRTYHDENHDEFLFGAGMSSANVKLSTLHPEQMQIFRLWQIYLENVQPLLAVTHPPTMQARILDAVADLTAISPELEALIFSIYCVSVLSLAPDECHRLFGSPRNQLLAGYQFACRQALLKCKVLRSDDRDCLTALFLYLVSVTYDTHPRSMSSMLAVAMHIAQRMGIHMERTYSRYSAFEAEMCRRLWWSLVTFSHRICELSEYRTTVLTPAWDCGMPLNLHDFEIRREMEAAPPAHEEPTGALFAVLRYLHADFLRHSAVHVGFANPCLHVLAARPGVTNASGDLAALERLMEDKYIAKCDSANPLYFTAIWTARASLSRTRLLEYYSRLASADGKGHNRSHQRQQEQQGNEQSGATMSCEATETEGEEEEGEEASMSYALTMLECDSRLLTSSLSRGFAWLVRLHFPMLAYVHVLRYLRRRRGGSSAGDATLSSRAWRVLGESYEAHAAEPKFADAISAVCSRLVLQAWDAKCGEGSSSSSSTGEVQGGKEEEVGMEVPRIVSDMRDKALQLGAAEPRGGGGGGGDMGHATVPVLMRYGWQDVLGLQGLPGSQAGGYSDVSPLGTSGIDTNQFWDVFDWKAFGPQGQ